MFSHHLGQMGKTAVEFSGSVHALSSCVCIGGGTGAEPHNPSHHGHAHVHSTAAPESAETVKQT